MSAVNKLMFPIADAASMVLAARVIDRIGKGIRDAPRDAFLTDLMPIEIRGSGFGLRLTFYTTGFVLGPLAAIGLMMLSGDNFRLVFWVAVIPAFLAIAVLTLAVREAPNKVHGGESFPGIHVRDLVHLPGLFWWSMAIACLLALARFSMAFLVLKAHDVGLDAAFVPMVLVVMHAVYSAAAYPFGLLADYMDRRLQLGLGALLLITAHVVLASAATVEMAGLGAALWGLQLAVTQGLLAASIADAAPDHLRGTAFGIYDLATGVATFSASAGAGVLWMVGGPVLTFGAGAGVAALALTMLLVRPMPKLAKSICPKPGMH
jgi:predicted MFS family arabinose efflux permease